MRQSFCFFPRLARMPRMRYLLSAAGIPQIVLSCGEYRWPCRSIAALYATLLDCRQSGCVRAPVVFLIGFLVS